MKVTASDNGTAVNDEDDDDFEFPPPPPPYTNDAVDNIEYAKRLN